jgi:hypothetical protein
VLWDLDSIVALGIQYLFLVGGFAESPILQYEIRRAFSSILKVIIPQDVSLTILKGSCERAGTTTVLTLGVFQVRCSSDSIQLLSMFVVLGWPTECRCSIVSFYHSVEKKIVKDNIEWCADIFDKFVLVDQSIGLGDIVIRKYTPARQNQAQCIISFYCSESDKPIYVTETGVRKIGEKLVVHFSRMFQRVFVLGTLVLDMFNEGYSFLSGKDRRREIQTRMVFGDTEIKVSALDVTTGKCVRATIDFLNKWSESRVRG